MIQRQIYFIVVAMMMQSLAFAQFLNEEAIQALSVTAVNSLNTSGSEFSPNVINGIVTYVTQGNMNRETDENVGERYWDLRTSTSLDNGVLIVSDYLSPKVNSPYHEGPFDFELRDSSLYFTRDYYVKGSLQSDDAKKVNLQIFKSKFKNGQWSDANPLSFTDKTYNICHPAIIHHTNSMVFSSNKPGGYGGMDLWMISLNATSIDEAINLGSKINSSGNEVFPFYHDLGYLVFSSDGSSDGFKNYDLFVTKGSDAFTIKERMTGAFSTDQDDLGIYISKDAKSGYFSSSRIGGKGRDDIYYFKSDQAIFSELKSSDLQLEADDERVSQAQIVEQIIEKDIATAADIKVIFKSQSLSNLTGINVVISELNNPSKSQQIQSNTNVLVLPNLLVGKNYKLEFSKAGYYTYYKNIFNAQAEEEYLIVMEPKKQDVVITSPVRKATEVHKEIFIPKEVGAIVVFENIYYEYNSAQIKNESADELNALVRAMKNEPSMEVRMVAHTDSRGNDDYNLNLSMERARSAKNYLVKNGISSNRILTLGVGETQIRNHCKNDVDCSDRAHRFNRRTEVQIIKR